MPRSAITPTERDCVPRSGISRSSHAVHDAWEDSTRLGLWTRCGWSPTQPRSGAEAPEIANDFGWNGCLELLSGAFDDLEEVMIEGWVKWMDDREYRRFFDFGKERRSVDAAGRFPTKLDIVLTFPKPGGEDDETPLVASDLFPHQTMGSHCGGHRPGARPRMETNRHE